MSEEPDKEQLNGGKSQRPAASARKSRSVIMAMGTEVVKKLEKGNIFVFCSKNSLYSKQSQVYFFLIFNF